MHQFQQFPHSCSNCPNAKHTLKCRGMMQEGNITANIAPPSCTSWRTIKSNQKQYLEGTNMADQNTNKCLLLLSLHATDVDQNVTLDMYFKIIPIHILTLLCSPAPYTLMFIISFNYSQLLALIFLLRTNILPARGLGSKIELLPVPSGTSPE